MKRVLIVDAVEYGPDELSGRLGGPPAWFGAALAEIPGVAVTAAGVSDPRLDELALSHDALVLSGAPGDAWADDEATLQYVARARRWLREGKPLFGVCHGHQILARAAGGHVGRNPAGWELGNVRVSLTAAGRMCPLFAGNGPELNFLESHQDAVLGVPAGAQVLAANDHTPVQALAYGPRQFSVQFHPEFSPEILRALWRDREKPEGFDPAPALESAQPTPEARKLFARFLDLVPDQAASDTP